MLTTPNLSPDALAQARATVNVKTATAPDIARIRNDWAALKAARGQPVNIARLPAAHLIGTDAGQQPGPPPSVTMAEVHDRALPRIVRAVRALGITPRSDLGGAA